jgi:macrolide-specific efflux system membrane fusion protein
MTTQVFFVAERAQNVLTAPISALNYGKQADHRLVQVVAENGTVQDREVRTGVSDRLRVQILDGLEEGDHLLISPNTGTGG